VYSQATLSRHLGFLANDDPVTFIVGEFREVLYWGNVVGLGHTVAMMTICTGFFLICLFLFRRAERGLAKDV
jgi:ABC-type polysaccharide/polyol phosphate export permease